MCLTHSPNKVRVSLKYLYIHKLTLLFTTYRSQFNDEKGPPLLITLKISHLHSHRWQRLSNVQRGNALHNPPPPFVTHRPSPPFIANPPCHHHHPFLAGVSFVFVTCPPPSLAERSNTIAFHHHPLFITPPLLERMVEGLCPPPPPCPSPPPCPPPTLLSNTSPLLTPPPSLPLFLIKISLFCNLIGI